MHTHVYTRSHNPHPPPTHTLGLQEGIILSSLSGVSSSTEDLDSPASLLLPDEGQSSRKKHKKEKTKHKKKKKHEKNRDRMAFVIDDWSVLLFAFVQETL